MFCWYMQERGGGVSSAWWHVRTALVAIFMGFGQAGAKWCGRCFISWGWRCKSQKGALFIGKAGSHYVILLYCETLLQVLLKDFIGYLFSLYYCCFTCFRLTKPEVQLKVS